MKHSLKSVSFRLDLINQKLENIQALLDNSEASNALSNSEYINIFVSYYEDPKGKNLTTLKSIEKDLQKYNINLFISKLKIEPTKDWREAIKENLATCDAAIIYETMGYKSSVYCLQESGWLLSRDIPIICITETNSVSELGFISELQSLSVDKNISLYKSILNWLHKSRLPKEKLANSLISALSKTVNDWYIRDDVWKEIEKFEFLEEYQISKICEIYDKSDNFQGGKYYGDREKFNGDKFSKAFVAQINTWQK